MTAALQFLLAFPNAPRLSVLTYHRIMAVHDPLRPGEPTAEEFEARMRWVASNFDVLPMTDAVVAMRNHRLPRRALCITFDDGYADNYELALPILRRLGLPATFFIATGYLDGGCMFNDIVIEAIRAACGSILDVEHLGFGRHPVRSNDDRLHAIARILARLRYQHPSQRDDVARAMAQLTGTTVPAGIMMTSHQVAGLQRVGMTLGAHTVTHPILAKVELQIARDEIVAGRERLEQIVGEAVRLFAYPNGNPKCDYLPQHVALLRDLGFDAAVTNAWGAAREGGDMFQIPRFTPWDRSNWRFGLRLARNRLTVPAAA